MTRAFVAILLASTAACDGVFNLDHVTQPAADADDGLEPLRCNPTLAPGNYSTESVAVTGFTEPALTEAQDVMYMQLSNGDLYYSTFSSTWSLPMPVTTLSDLTWYASYPRLSYDGQSIFFARHVRGSSTFDLPYMSHRTAGNEAWEPPTAVEYPPVFAGGDIAFGVPNANGKRVMVTHGSSGHYHLTEVVLVNGIWTIVDTTSALYPVTADVSDTNSQLSPDACWLVFARIDRDVDVSDHEVMFSVRGADGKFGPAQKLLTNASTANEQHPWLAPDASALYYHLPDGAIHRATRM